MTLFEQYFKAEGAELDALKTVILTAISTSGGMDRLVEEIAEFFNADESQPSTEKVWVGWESDAALRKLESFVVQTSERYADWVELGERLQDEIDDAAGTLFVKTLCIFSGKRRMPKEERDDEALAEYVELLYAQARRLDDSPRTLRVINILDYNKGIFASDCQDDPSVEVFFQMMAAERAKKSGDNIGAAICGFRAVVAKVNLTIIEGDDSFDDAMREMTKWETKVSHRCGPRKNLQFPDDSSMRWWALNVPIHYIQNVWLVDKEWDDTCDELFDRLVWLSATNHELFQAHHLYIRTIFACKLDKSGNHDMAYQIAKGVIESADNGPKPSHHALALAHFVAASSVHDPELELRHLKAILSIDEGGLKVFKVIAQQELDKMEKSTQKQ